MTLARAVPNLIRHRFAVISSGNPEEGGKMSSRLLCGAGVAALALFAAACGSGGELTSDQAQALLDEQMSAGTAEVLGVRQVSEQEAVARVRLAGSEAGEIDVTFVLFDTGWRPEGVQAMGRTVPLPEMLGAAHRGRQRRTMADMRNVATANFVMREDTGRYAQNLAELAENEYLRVAPTTDGWGNAYVYMTGANTYTLTSLGSDGAAGPAPPRVWLDEPYDPDIVLTDGQFTQAPTGR
jgi:hypothetical protein